MLPQTASAICDCCDEIIEQVHEYWMNLNRNGKCEVCGGRENDIDEDWIYCVKPHQVNYTALPICRTQASL
jgi:hypothetical protein